MAFFNPGNFFFKIQGYIFTNERVGRVNRFGKETKDGVMIDVPLRHQDIGSSINASRETTSRELVKLDRKGFIKQGNARIVLKDTQKLQDYL